MKQTLFATTLASVLAFGFAASAQSQSPTNPTSASPPASSPPVVNVTSQSPSQSQSQSQSPFDMNAPPVGKKAGTFMIRLRAIGVIPLNSSSSISGIGGHVSATAQAAPELDFSYFLTDNIAFELIAATTRHNISAHGTTLGTVDVGSVWVLPPTLTVQYHFMPHSAFSPYIGAGINATFFYGSHAAGPTVTGVTYDDNVGAAIQAGFDYNFSGHWFFNADVKQIFLNTTAHINTVLGPIKAKTALNPLVVGMGIGYRF